MKTKKSEKYSDELSTLFTENLHGITENAVYPDHVNILDYEPRTLVDETLEVIDPTPNVYTMFIQFNEKFFWNKLASVQVKWSKRMTLCAGVCSFKYGNKECVIALSEPLLKLRPRKDLVETLLHEMIHGYLFLTNNNRDRDGHGPEFCKHMRRINLAAGTNITIYHDFHDEVRLYQQHWWRCTGPCQKRAPFFGIVRRSINRAPGPSDKWWSDHQRNCNGKFVKIREPDASPAPKSKQKTLPKLPPNQNTMDKYISSPKNGIPSVKPGSSKTGAVKKGIPASIVPPEGFKKLGTGSNNVFGFGTGGPGSCPCKSPASTGPLTNASKQPRFVGVVGGSSTGRSNLLDRFSSTNTVGVDGGTPTGRSDLSDRHSTPSATVTKLSEAQCPVCNKSLPETEINAHLDKCLQTENEPPLRKRPKTSEEGNKTKAKPPAKVEEGSSPHKCPICSENVSPDMINEHLDACLLREDNATSLPPNNRHDDAPAQQSKINIIECISCHAHIREHDINSHLDMCLAFDDDFGEPMATDVDLGNSSLEKTHDYIECPTCNMNVKVKVYITHVDHCLERRRKKDANDSLPTVVLDDDDDKSTFKKPESSTDIYYKCLVCNASVKKSIPLDVHLESCIAEIYGDLSELDEPFDASTESVSDEKKDFCPICKTVVNFREMAVHVDHCVETFTPAE